MTELSPAAQAVLDAFRTSHTGAGCLAAALRAAADQILPSTSDWHESFMLLANELEA